MSGTECAYCGCDVTAHDPVSVREWNGDGSTGADSSGDGSARDGSTGEEPDGAEGKETPFCNYGCLTAHVEERGLALGTTCSLEP